MVRALLIAGALLVSWAAMAQTPEHVVVGTESTTGCAGSVTPCWSPNAPNSPDSPTSVTIVGPDGPEGGVSVSINPFREDSTNFAGSITVGGAWQMVAPANPLRQRFFVQNRCTAQTQGIATTESIFLAVRATMPTQSPLVAPAGTELVTCGAYDTSSAVISVSPVWLWAATSGHMFQALEW